MSGVYTSSFACFGGVSPTHNPCTRAHIVNLTRLSGTEGLPRARSNLINFWQSTGRVGRVC